MDERDVQRLQRLARFLLELSHARGSVQPCRAPKLTFELLGLLRGKSTDMSPRVQLATAIAEIASAIAVVITWLNIRTFRVRWSRRCGSRIGMTCTRTASSLPLNHTDLTASDR